MVLAPRCQRGPLTGFGIRFSVSAPDIKNVRDLSSFRRASDFQSEGGGSIAHRSLKFYFNYKDLSKMQIIIKSAEGGDHAKRIVHDVLKAYTKYLDRKA